MLFNACLCLNYFPAVWKHANILPFPKPGKDSRQPQNYRPISLLSSISKILERVMYTRCYTHLDGEDILRPQQMGFREHHGTTHQITRLVEHITEGFNLNLHTGVVFLDASAAFDTVWTRGLLFKMTEMRFPAELIKMMQSYLTGRTFHVSLDGAQSERRQVANGTPQGSILGPVLFIMYVNDIPCPGRARLAQYADDTAAFHRAKTIPALVRQLQRALDALLAYFHRWHIKINDGKTEAVIFSKRHLTAAAAHPLRANATPLPWRSHAKFLGVTLDSRLNLNQHISNTQRKARGAMSVLHPLINKRSVLDEPLKLRIATAYVKPILTYAAPAWSGILSDTKLRKLQVIQNKYIRMALGLSRHTNMRRTHSQHNIKHLGDSVMHLTDKFFTKCTNSTNPLIAGLGAYTPETVHYRLKHKMPSHRLHMRDA